MEVVNKLCGSSSRDLHRPVLCDAIRTGPQPPRPPGGLMRRRFAPWLALAVASALSLAACGGSDGSSGSSGDGTTATTKVSVGVIPIIDVAPLYLGIAKGFFSKRGLEVKPVPAQGGAAIVPAVVSGSQQFGFSNV